jgi:hypothetical protein
MRRSAEEPVGSVTTVPVDELTSVVARFDEGIAELTVGERNDQRLVTEAIDRTVAWYGRNVFARTGVTLTFSQNNEVANIIAREAPGIIAARNADRLVTDLNSMERDLGSSGLGIREERRLSSEIEWLRRNLLRDGHYHREFDDALVRIASVVRIAKGAWADNHLRIIEQYVERGRWWLR